MRTQLVFPTYISVSMCDYTAKNGDFATVER